MLLSVHKKISKIYLHTNDTIVNSCTYDMKFGNFLDTIKESYSEKLTKGSYYE